MKNLHIFTPCHTLCSSLSFTLSSTLSSKIRSTACSNPCSTTRLLTRSRPARSLLPRGQYARSLPPPGLLDRLCACLGLLAAMLVGMAAHAQDAADRTAAPRLEEVLVTAELRSTPRLDQPGSTTVIDGDLALRRNAVHLENLLRLAPNVNIAGGTSRARFYQVRGIGERSQFVEPLNPSVGVLIDDIDFSGLGAAALLYDIDQVEVLRGPQGTLHGANALAGLINMRSAMPEDRFAARINATVGDYGRREVGASATGPLGSDALLYRVAAFRHESDGFMRNAFLGRDDTNDRDETLLRTRLRWLASDTQTLDLTLMHTDADNGYDAFSLDNTRVTLSDEPGRDRQRSNALGLRYTLEGESVTTEVLASAADTDSEYSYDEDWSFVGIEPAFEYSSFDRYRRERRSYSAQLRLRSGAPLSTAAGGLSWTTGLYALSDDESLRRDYTYLAAPFSSRFQADTVAAFGQLDLDVTERWTVSAGLRVARRAMDYRDSSDVRSEPDNNLWGGKLALSYTDPRLGLFYTALSRGYRAGGVNAGILAFPDDGDLEARLAPLRFFATEQLYNLELGHKGRFLDERLESTLTLFYMDRRDQQVRGSLVIPRDDGSTAFVDFTDNAAAGYNLGLEWELRARTSDHLDVYLNLGLLRARFDDYINADGRDLEGRAQAHAPSYQFAAGLSYRPLPALLLDLQYEGGDAFYFSDRHDARSEAFGLVNLRLAWQARDWELSLWSRNLLDDDYFTRGFGSFGNDPRKGYVVEEYRQFGEPRQLGASVEYRF